MPAAENAAPFAIAQRVAKHPVLWAGCVLCAATAWAFAGGALAWALTLLITLMALAQLVAHWTVAAPPMNIDQVEVDRADFIDALDRLIEICTSSNTTTATLLIEIEEVLVVSGKWGFVAHAAIMEQITNRISLCLRDGDSIRTLGPSRLGIMLGPIRRADLDTAKSLAERIRAANATPLEINGRSVHVQTIIGFCALSRAPERSGTAFIAAAECALQAARKSSSSLTCAFTPAMQSQVETAHHLLSYLPDALEEGEFKPWFQPQVCAETGEISGFEALARWHHPELGLLMPGQFLGAISAVSALPRLGEVMLTQSLQALKSWDRAGLRVPNVGINLSLEELRDPWLADGLQFELDRFDIDPSRLAIEILEHVTLRDDEEVVVRNLQTLSRAGCRLELDDFGTGHTSVRHVARFGAKRVKIDRSFVAGIDQDMGQKRLVSAILAMAEQLGVETLAEGVETPGEHSTLAQLGCQFVQGYGLSKPMPFEETIPWIAAHQARISAASAARRRNIG